ncbi:unnamed protein product [Rotaria sordida]|uniref:Uncharacterized protein n=1 Tax=Rotaria sordida TaxID=392033 RepID=A0A814RX88_9BILA|nr:unnamed protein product [Rotaria sordida]CAF1367998.1 unnamed protein product [Rotaria sordida]CAF3999741.1 unnamed protein product [Rotaria sordida]
MTIEEIDDLFLIAQETHHFIFDTESDYRTNHPVLIQIFFMLDTQQISLLLIVEANLLPDYASIVFNKLQQLFNIIFRDDSYLYCWGLLLAELNSFLQFQLFSLPLPSYLHNSQTVFKI